MLYTIVDLNDVFRSNDKIDRCCRSSNPYDYIRTGYFLDNAALYGGYNNVSYNCNIPKYIPSNRLDIANK